MSTSFVHKLLKVATVVQLTVNIAQQSTNSRSLRLQVAMLLISALALGLVETSSGKSNHIADAIGSEKGENSLNSNTVIAMTPNRAGANTAGNAGIVGGEVLGLATALGAGSLPHASSTSTPVGSSAGGGTITWDKNGTLRSANPGDWSLEQCIYWHRPHHLYFQLGNAFFLLAFLAPHRPFGMLWLRAFLIIGSILMGMYGYLISCLLDVLLWSGLFLGINLIYLIVVLCRLRPVRFEKEIEAVYTSLFKPLRVSRQQFKKILNCMKLIRALKYQEVYAQEKVTKVDSLSLVLSGKLVVSQNQRALHIVFPHQFLDSPEWFGVSTDDFFQVSIMAMEESRVLIWHRDKLKLSIMGEPFLQTVFDHILGRDVVKKLMQVTQVSESIASNGFLPSGAYGDDGEDKPMLIMKKTIEGHGLTALINRQLQEEHAPLLGRTYGNNSNNFSSNKIVNKNKNRHLRTPPSAMPLMAIAATSAAAKVTTPSRTSRNSAYTELTSPC